MSREGKEGFTLIEAAVILLIVGVVSVMAMRLLGVANEGLRARLTRQNVDAVRQALQAYMVRAGRLPCPAIETLTSSDTAYGLEAPTPGCTGTTAIDSPTVAFRGVVPWKTLGLTTESAFDAWGRQITYVVTNTATSLTAATLSGLRGSLYLHSGTPVAAGLPATGNQINACSTTAGDNNCNAAAAVMLVSFGQNGAGAYNVTGIQGPLPTSATELENTDADRNFVLIEPSESFDDVVVPLSPNELLAPLYLQGAASLPEALFQERARQAVSLIAADQVSSRVYWSGDWYYLMPVPSSTVAYLFDATRFVGCDTTAPGVGTLSGDTALALDPWGQEFRYARASLTVYEDETCTAPMAIVSVGPDGVLNTSDDKIYYSSLAEWKSIFEKSGWN